MCGVHGGCWGHGGSCCTAAGWGQKRKEAFGVSAQGPGNNKQEERLRQRASSGRMCSAPRADPSYLRQTLQGPSSPNTPPSLLCCVLPRGAQGWSRVRRAGGWHPQGYGLGGRWGGTRTTLCTVRHGAPRQDGERLGRSPGKGTWTGRQGLEDSCWLPVGQVGSDVPRAAPLHHLNHPTSALQPSLARPSMPHGLALALAMAGHRRHRAHASGLARGACGGTPGFWRRQGCARRRRTAVHWRGAGPGLPAAQWS